MFDGEQVEPTSEKPYMIAEPKSSSKRLGAGVRIAHQGPMPMLTASSRDRIHVGSRTLTRSSKVLAKEEESIHDHWPFNAESHYGVAEDGGYACVRDSEQSDAVSDAGWLLHRVKGTPERRDRLAIEPCNKAIHLWNGPSGVFGENFSIKSFSGTVEIYRGN